MGGGVQPEQHRRLTETDQHSRAAALIGYARAWQPWRAYASQYLWATSDHPINRLPGASPTKPTTAPRTAARPARARRTAVARTPGPKPEIRATAVGVVVD